MKKGLLLLLTFGLVLSFDVVSAKSYSCETVDGAYYGKNGDEVDKVQYETECLSHSCEIIGDSYFGANGNKVSKSIFEKECDATVVSDFPDTGSNVSPTELFLGILGSALLLGVMVFSISYRHASDKN